MASSPGFAATPKITPVTFTNSDSANTKKTIHTAGNSGSKVVSVMATSTDNTARVAQLWLTRSNASYLLGAVTVAINAGSDGTAVTASVLANLAALPMDNDGQRYVFLESGDSLQVSFTTQVTNTKQIDVVAIGGNL